MIKKFIKHLINKRAINANRKCVNRVIQRVDDIALDLLQNEEIHDFVKNYMDNPKMIPHTKAFTLCEKKILTIIEASGRNPNSLRLRVSVCNMTFLNKDIYPEYVSKEELINKGFKITDLTIGNECFFFTAQPLGNTLVLMTN